MINQIATDWRTIRLTLATKDKTEYEVQAEVFLTERTTGDPFSHSGADVQYEAELEGWSSLPEICCERNPHYAELESLIMSALASRDWV